MQNVAILTIRVFFHFFLGKFGKMCTFLPKVKNKIDLTIYAFLEMAYSYCVAPSTALRAGLPATAKQGHNELNWV